MTFVWTTIRENDVRLNNNSENVIRHYEVSLIRRFGYVTMRSNDFRQFFFGKIAFRQNDDSMKWRFGKMMWPHYCIHITCQFDKIDFCNPCAKFSPFYAWKVWQKWYFLVKREKNKYRTYIWHPIFLHSFWTLITFPYTLCQAPANLHFLQKLVCRHILVRNEHRMKHVKLIAHALSSSAQLHNL